MRLCPKVAPRMLPHRILATCSLPLSGERHKQRCRCYGIPAACKHRPPWCRRLLGQRAADGLGASGDTARPAVPRQALHHPLQSVGVLRGPHPRRTPQPPLQLHPRSISHLCAGALPRARAHAVRAALRADRRRARLRLDGARAQSVRAGAAVRAAPHGAPRCGCPASLRQRQGIRIKQL